MFSRDFWQSASCLMLAGRLSVKNCFSHSSRLSWKDSLRSQTLNVVTDIATH